MDKKIAECALKDVPKSMIDKIVGDYIKNRIKDIMKEDDDFLNNIDEKIKDKINQSLMEKLEPFVKEYIEKNGRSVVNNIIDSIFEDEIPGKIYDAIVKYLTKSFEEKLNA